MNALRSDLQAFSGGLLLGYPTDALHGVVLHPLSMGWNGERYIGNKLKQVNGDAVQHMPGVVAVVQQENFAGLVAMTPVHASQAAENLAVQWERSRMCGDENPESYLAAASESTYTWRFSKGQMPSRAIAWVLNDRVSVWLPPITAMFRRMLLSELACLLKLPSGAVEIFAKESEAHSSSDLCLLDAAADAALLSMHVQRPVSVACGTGQGGVLAIRGGHEDGHVTLRANAPWAVRPSKARLLAHLGNTQAVSNASIHNAGRVEAKTLSCNVSHASIEDFNAAQVFAYESQWAEMATLKGACPVETRLGQMEEGRGLELAKAVLNRSGYTPGAIAEEGLWKADGHLSGRGFATAQVECIDARGEPQMVWSAWVADVAVNAETGEIAVTRVVAGHDVQALRTVQQVNVQLTSSQNDPQMLKGVQRLLLDSGEPLLEGAQAVTAAAPATLMAYDASRDLISSGASGVIADGQLAVEGVMTLPAAAAIANAVQQATGVRLRNMPLDAQELRLALGLDKQVSSPSAVRRWGWLGAGAAALASMAVMAWPAKSALPLTDGPDLSVYSAQALERGRLVAAAGDCVVCHTAPGGAENSGGLGLPTPFGTIYTTNITPDKETGIGRWSYAAFERAMRHGVHQDGRQLYPAFPYTAFAKMNEADMQALYGYLMSQPAVKAENPQTELAFPYSMRSTLAGWNVLFHDAKPFQADRSKSLEWNRGAYLVQGAGHCSACHSPRNALGAEKTGIGNYLAGGEAEGWVAPALNKLGQGNRPWSKDELVRYMRSGYSANHGVAAGPMAPVIHGLAQLPESDVQAIASYLLDLPGISEETVAMPEQAPVAAPASVPVLNQSLSNGERMYQSACAVCHEVGAGPTLFGVKPDLRKNSSLHASTPQNLIQVVLHGISQPSDDALGYMPGFKDSFDNQQIMDLLGYLRGRFAPEEKAWQDNTTLIEQLRTQAH